jgi:hypothetical protein
MLGSLFLLFGVVCVGVGRSDGAGADGAREALAAVVAECARLPWTVRRLIVDVVIVAEHISAAIVRWHVLADVRIGRVAR